MDDLLGPDPTGGRQKAQLGGVTNHDAVAEEMARKTEFFGQMVMIVPMSQWDALERLVDAVARCRTPDDELEEGEDPYQCAYEDAHEELARILNAYTELQRVKGEAE